MKIINKDHSNDNNGSGNNNDNDVQDFGDNYGDSYSSHHEICDDKDDNDDDNSDNNDQIVNARITILYRRGRFLDLSILLHFLKFRVSITVHGIYYRNIFRDIPELLKSYSFLLERSDRTILGQGFGLSEKSLL